MNTEPGAAARENRDTGKPVISLIVAAASNNAIGKNNQLLWHLPNDLKFFKNTTWAMPVIMGRKTYESISKDPLPGRYNIVVTSQENWSPSNDKVWVAGSIDEAIEKARATDCNEVFIAGGGKIYEETIDRADRIYLTRVHATLEADVFFPVIDEKKWKLKDNLDFPADEKHAWPYSFQLWERNTNQK